VYIALIDHIAVSNSIFCIVICRLSMSTPITWKYDVPDTLSAMVINASAERYAIVDDVTANVPIEPGAKLFASLKLPETNGPIGPVAPV
jgi:hypothetical protein